MLKIGVVCDAQQHSDFITRLFFHCSLDEGRVPKRACSWLLPCIKKTFSWTFAPKKVHDPAPVLPISFHWMLNYSVLKSLISTSLSGGFLTWAPPPLVKPAFNISLTSFWPVYILLLSLLSLHNLFKFPVSNPMCTGMVWVTFSCILKYEFLH